MAAAGDEGFKFSLSAPKAIPTAFPARPRAQQSPQDFSFYIFHIFVILQGWGPGGFALKTLKGKEIPLPLTAVF